MDTELIIALVMLFLGSMSGVAFTICTYSSRARRKIATFCKMNSDSLGDYLASNVATSLSAYEQIQNGNAEAAVGILADQVAGFAAFAAMQTTSSVASAGTVELINSACRRHAALKQKVDRSVGEVQGKTVDQMIEEMEQELAHNQAAEASVASAPQPHR